MHGGVVGGPERRVRAQERQQRRKKQHDASGGGEAGEHARRAGDARRDRPLQPLEQRIEVPRPVVADAVGEQRRRTGDAVAPSVRHILLDARADLGAVEIRGELRHVQSERARVLDDARFGHRLVAVVDPVVHLPETALIGGRLGGLRDPRRARVSALVREVAEGVDQPIAQRRAEPQHHAAEALAIGTQEIAVGDDFDAVARAGSADVIARGIDASLQVHSRRARR